MMLFPVFFCQKFKYTDIDRETRAYHFKDAIHLLEQAKVIKKIKTGIHISQQKLSCNDNILSIPLYLIGQLPRFFGYGAHIQ